jgi:hypothetical protein
MISSARRKPRRPPMVTTGFIGTRSWQCAQRTKLPRSSVSSRGLVGASASTTFSSESAV